MRKQYDELWALASQHLGIDPKGGALFAFTNKTRDRIKLLHWDGSGVRILAKRFSWPRGAGGDDRKLSLEPAGLTLLLDGVDLKHCAKNAWHER
jgi:transposase